MDRKLAKAAVQDQDLEVPLEVTPAEVDTFGTVRGFTVRVGSGGYFDFLDPQPGQFRFSDLGLGLSREGRFCNQTLYHHTVAMHLLNCLDVAKKDGVDIETQKAVLMHDASEAILKDIPKPLKMLLPGYVDIERRVQSLICVKYGIQQDDPGINDYVKQVDREMLIAEKHELFTHDGVVWQDEGRVRKQWPNLFLHLDEITDLAYHFKVAAETLGINTEI